MLPYASQGLCVFLHMHLSPWPSPSAVPPSTALLKEPRAAGALEEAPATRLCHRRPRWLQAAVVLGKTRALRHQDRKHNVLLVLETFISRVNNNNKLVYGCEFHCLPQWGSHLLPSVCEAPSVEGPAWHLGGRGQGSPGCCAVSRAPAWVWGDRLTPLVGPRQTGVSRSFWALTCLLHRCLFSPQRKK